MNSKKIMVCDDDEGISNVIKLMLEESGYKVILVSGKHILKKIKELRPDLILLDIWMPDVDGEQITKALKHSKELKDIPVVLISALNKVKDITKRSGANDYLEKPFSMDDLLDKVTRNLAIHGSYIQTHVQRRTTFS